MRFLTTAFLLLTGSLLLSACTQYAWVKPFGDPATFSGDNYGCKQDSLGAAPPVYQTYGPYPHFHGPDLLRTRCYDDGFREVCRTRYTPSHGYVSPPTTVDLNARQRGDLYNACMNAKGWVLQPVETPR